MIVSPCMAGFGCSSGLAVTEDGGILFFASRRHLLALPTALWPHRNVSKRGSPCKDRIMKLQDPQNALTLKVQVPNNPLLSQTPTYKTTFDFIIGSFGPLGGRVQEVLEYVAGPECAVYLGVQPGGDYQNTLGSISTINPYISKSPIINHKLTHLPYQP